MRPDLIVARRGAPSDQVVKHDGNDVIHIANEISQAADSATLDRLDTPEGPTLTITPPPQEEDVPPV